MKTTRNGTRNTVKNSEKQKIKYELSDLDKPLRDTKKFGEAEIKPSYLSDLDFFFFASRYITVGFSEEHRRDILEVIMNLPDAPQFVVNPIEVEPIKVVEGIIPIGAGEQELEKENV